MLGIVIGPATSLVALDRAAAEPSTRVVAQRWIGKHIPRGSGVAVEIRGPDLTGTHYRYVQHYTLPSSGTVADYAQAGFRYLVINEGIASKFAAHPHRSGEKAAFYDYLVGDAHLLANFRRDRVHPGPHLEVYDLGRSIRLRDVDSAREPSELTTLMISHDNDAAEKPGPDPVAQRGLLQLARQSRSRASRTPRGSGAWRSRPDEFEDHGGAASGNGPEVDRAPHSDLGFKHGERVPAGEQMS
jgi:hypothetical protein